MFALLLMLVLGHALLAEDGLNVGAGSFVFQDAKGNEKKPITVYYYRPGTLKANSKILFVMHGSKRRGKQSRDAWVEYSKKCNFLLIAPTFSAEYYNGRRYNRGNVRGKGKRGIEESKWTVSSIEHLFDHVKELIGNKSSTYIIFGHSAGAQFVHRLVLMKPDARIETAIAANAGWYTVPTFTKRYPYGLDGIGYNGKDLKKVFARKLILLLGEDDTDENGANFMKTSGAMAQGKHRFERGNYFFKKAASYARKKGIRFNWELHTVPGVGHSSNPMAGKAMGLLVENGALKVPRTAVAPPRQADSDE